MAVFDKVSVAGKVLSPGEWTAIPLTDRVNLLCEGKVQFLLGAQVVDTKEALQSLKNNR